MQAADNGGYRSGGPEDNTLCPWEGGYGRSEGQCYMLRHEASTVWMESILVFCNLMLCSGVDRFRRFGRTYCLRMKRFRTARRKGVNSIPEGESTAFETSGSNTANIPS